MSSYTAASHTYRAINAHALINLHTILLVSAIVAGSTFSSFFNDGAIWYRTQEAGVTWRRRDTIVITIESILLVVSLCTAIITQRKIVALQAA